MGKLIPMTMALLMTQIGMGVNAAADAARSNGREGFSPWVNYSHTALRDFVPSNPSPSPAPSPSHNPSPQPNCNNGNSGGNWGGGNWGNWSWGNGSSGISWGSGNWGNWGGGHVHCARCYWVNGGYQWQWQTVWIPDHWEPQWTPPLYRYDVYEGQVYPVLVRRGYYADVYINGYYENQRVSIWFDGYWVCF